MALSPAAKLLLASSLSPDSPNDVAAQATTQDMQGSVAAAPNAAAPEPETGRRRCVLAASEGAKEVQTAEPLQATPPTAEARAAPAIAETSKEVAPTSAQAKEVQVAKPSQASPPAGEPAKEIEVAEPPQATPPASAEAPATPAVAETATEAASASEPAKKTQVAEPPQATSPASAEAPASPAVAETSTEAAPASEPLKETQVAEPPPAAQPVTAAPAQDTPTATVAPAHQAAPPVASGVDTPPASAAEPSTPSEPVTVPAAPTGAVAAEPAAPAAVAPPSVAAPAAPSAPEPPKPAAAAPRYAAPDPAALVTRGDAMLELGDVSAARLLYERAAALGNAKAATAAGKTYDPAFLVSIQASGLVPDRATAAIWYQKELPWAIARPLTASRNCPHPNEKPDDRVPAAPCLPRSAPRGQHRPAAVVQAAAPADNPTARANAGTVGIISGGVDGTYVRIAADLSAVLDDGQNLRVLTVLRERLAAERRRHPLSARHRRRHRAVGCAGLCRTAPSVPWSTVAPDHRELSFGGAYLGAPGHHLNRGPGG